MAVWIVWSAARHQHRPTRAELIATIHDNLDAYAAQTAELSEGHEPPPTTTADLIDVESRATRLGADLAEADAELSAVVDGNWPSHLTDDEARALHVRGLRTRRALIASCHAGARAHAAAMRFALALD